MHMHKFTLIYNNYLTYMCGRALCTQVNQTNIERLGGLLPDWLPGMLAGRLAGWLAGLLAGLVVYFRITSEQSVTIKNQARGHDNNKTYICHRALKITCQI